MSIYLAVIEAAWGVGLAACVAAWRGLSREPGPSVGVWPSVLGCATALVYVAAVLWMTMGVVAAVSFSHKGLAMAPAWSYCVAAGAIALPSCAAVASLVRRPRLLASWSASGLAAGALGYWAARVVVSLEGAPPEAPSLHAYGWISMLAFSGLIAAPAGGLLLGQWWEKRAGSPGPQGGGEAG
jgi:hypothetical protein